VTVSIEQYLVIVRFPSTTQRGMMMQIERCIAGIDVHKKMLAVVVGKTQERSVQVERAKFGTTTQDLEVLRDWLQSRRVEEVVMESTGQYHKPVWLQLEGQFRLHLAQAQSNRGPKGRKGDFADALRLVKRFLSDDLILSYVPDVEQRLWRRLTRTKTSLGEQRKRVQLQVEALLEEMMLKLSSVVSDLLGSSGRRILKAIAAGEEDPAKLASLGNVRLKASEEELQRALNGRARAAHRLILGLYLKQVELIDEQEAILEREISAAMQAQKAVVERLADIPGLGVDSAHQIIAEMGPEAAAFPSAGQAASWIGVCPGREESAGESRNNRSPKGNRSMRRLLNQLAWASIRAKGSYFQTLFQRLTSRKGVKLAIWAVAHRLLRLIWKILHEKVRYVEHGPRSGNLNAIQKRKRALVRQLRRLGYAVQITPIPGTVEVDV
jgi:transposase